MHLVKPKAIFWRIYEYKFKKMIRYILGLILLFGLWLSVSSCTIVSDDPVLVEPPLPQDTLSFRYLALGDSYTIGESVCDVCAFPIQLLDTLEKASGFKGDQKTIARTGWTTSNLISEIANEKPDSNYQLVTLLIGVNNQYQGKDFSIYEEEFPFLLEQAIAFAKGDPNRVIVVSIPDYAFTPFGQNSSNAEKISQEIDQYNAFAKFYTESQGVYFQEITDITREGLNQPDLVASDGLHPSEIAYSLFVERLFDRSFVQIR